MRQLKSLERQIQTKETLRRRYQRTIDPHGKAGYVSKIHSTELNQTKDKLDICYIVLSSLIEPQKKVCNAAAKYKELALNDKFSSGEDLLQSLIGITFASEYTQEVYLRSCFYSNCCPKQGQQMSAIYLA